MATRIHEKITCPYCSWNSRIHKLPAHLIGQHLENITLKTGLTTDHSIDAFIIHGKKRIDFTACLTCGAGVVDNTTNYIVRWRNHHCTKKDCIKAHPDAYRLLKEKIQRLNEEAPPVMSQHTSLVTWNLCKAHNTTLYNIMTRIEHECKADYVDDSDNEGEFTFDPMDGFTRIAKENIGYATRLEKTRNQLHEATIKIKELEQRQLLLEKQITS